MSVCRNILPATITLPGSATDLRQVHRPARLQRLCRKLQSWSSGFSRALRDRRGSGSRLWEMPARRESLIPKGSQVNPPTL
jgi:hypothetical protein